MRLAQGHSQQSIADSLNVSRGAIDGIARGISWKHLD